MDSELKATVERLQSAVALVMDPLTPSHLRREASDVRILYYRSENAVDANEVETGFSVFAPHLVNRACDRSVSGEKGAPRSSLFL